MMISGYGICFIYDKMVNRDVFNLFLLKQRKLKYRMCIFGEGLPLFKFLRSSLPKSPYEATLQGKKEELRNWNWTGTEVVV